MVLTQSQDAQSDDDLLTGGNSSDEPVQNTVITNKCHNGLRKLGITGNVQRRAAVKHWQRLTGDTQEVTGLQAASNATLLKVTASFP